MFLLFAKFGWNFNTVQSELSPIVERMEFGWAELSNKITESESFSILCSVYCLIFSLILLIIVYCIINFSCLIVMLIWADKKCKSCVVILFVSFFGYFYLHIYHRKKPVVTKKEKMQKEEKEEDEEEDDDDEEEDDEEEDEEEEEDEDEEDEDEEQEEKGKKKKKKAVPEDTLEVTSGVCLYMIQIQSILP